jgi:hypothetical protein
MTICESPSTIRRDRPCSLDASKPLSSPQIFTALLVLYSRFIAVMWSISPLLLRMDAPYPVGPRFPLEALSKFIL